MISRIKTIFHYTTIFASHDSFKCMIANLKKKTRKLSPDCKIVIPY